MTEFSIGKSLVTQRRDIVLGRHCESWLHLVAEINMCLTHVLFFIPSGDSGFVTKRTNNATMLSS